jgi:hypothetical protein
MRLLALQSEELGKYCFGWVVSKGMKNRFCVKLNSGVGACGVSGHQMQRVWPVGDAYYVRTRGDSVLLWPFVLKKHLEETEELDIASALLSTKDHVAALNYFYDRNPACYEELLQDARTAQLLGVTPKPRTSRNSSSVDGNEASSMTRALAGMATLNMDEGLDGSDALRPPSNVQIKSDEDARSIKSSSVVNSYRFDSWDGIDEDIRPFEELLPITVFDSEALTDLSASEEPWAKSDRILSSAIQLLLDHCERMTELTTQTFRDDKTAHIMARETTRDLIKSVDKIRDHISGGLLPPDPDLVKRFGSLWNAISQLSSGLEEALDSVADCVYQCNSATEKLLALESSVDTATFDAEMDQVVKLFSLVNTKIEDSVRQCQQMVSSLRSELGGSRPSDGVAASAPYLHGRFASLNLRQYVDDEVVVGGVGSVSNVGDAASDPSVAAAIAALTTRMNAQDRRIEEQDRLITDQAAVLQEQDRRLIQQESTISALKLEVLSLSGQGGNGVVRLSRWNFPDVKALEEFLRANNFNPTRVAVFVDWISLLAHSPDSYKKTEELGEQMKLATKLGIQDLSSHKAIFSFSRVFPPGLKTNADGEIKDGETFPMLSSMQEWSGFDGNAGARVKFLEKVSVASERHQTYADTHTSNDLKEFVMWENRTSQRFWTDVMAYIHNDLERLRQFGIPEKDCLVLVSEQLRIIFDQTFSKRMHMPELSTENDKFEYAAQIAWHTLQAHAVMDDFSSKKFTGHGLLGNTFIRFLARQLGASSAANLAEKLATLETQWKKQLKDCNKRVDEALESVKKSVAEIKKRGQNN